MQHDDKHGVTFGRDGRDLKLDGGPGLRMRSGMPGTSGRKGANSIAGDPVELGLVAGLARPGGNITGFAEMNAEVLSKRLEILHELLPRATRFVLLTHSSVPVAASHIASLKAGASINGWQVEVRNLAGSLQETDAILETEFVGLVQKQIDALLISPGGVFFNLRGQLATLSVRYKLPAIYWDRGLVEAGGLISYGSNIVDQFRRVGVYAGRILKGEKPGDMPVQLPTKFELVINLKTAKALGLEVPWFLQQRADEVIE
jgi:putative ABC transport system substrate-binding protein